MNGETLRTLLDFCPVCYQMGDNPCRTESGRRRRKVHDARAVQRMLRRMAALTSLAATPEGRSAIDRVAPAFAQLLRDALGPRR